MNRTHNNSKERNYIIIFIITLNYRYIFPLITHGWKFRNNVSFNGIYSIKYFVQYIGIKVNN